MPLRYKKYKNSKKCCHCKVCTKL